MKMLLVLVAMLAALALSGCGTPAGPITPPLEDGKYVVHLTAASTFSPMTATVPVGATVAWVTDGGTHDVSAQDNSWSSDDTVGHKLNQGDRYEHTFTTVGTFSYICKIHASTGMKGTLTVA